MTPMNVILLAVWLVGLAIGIATVLSGDAKGYWLALAAGGFVVVQLWVIRHEGARPPARPTDPSEEELADIARSITLADAARPERKPGEPLALWLECPGETPFSMIWRMGAEAEAERFWSLVSQMSREVREDYFARYDLGPDWPQRELWRDAMFRDLGDE